MTHFNSPEDAYRYIIESGKEMEFITAIMKVKGGYSIAEIADGKFKIRDGKNVYISPGFKINVEIDDEEIVTAVHNELYVSSFISRKGEAYNVHFLVSPYPASMKARFEDEIAKDVVKYMIISAVVALGLNTDKKVIDYLG